MTMQLVTNSVSATQVRETDGAFIIEDVPFIKSMRLAGGYVPKWSIESTAEGWNGRPPTLNHPRNENGKPIAANRKPELHLGEIQNARFDGTHVRANIRIEKSRLNEIGGEAKDIKQALESGEEINVSSQYTAEDLPPGEYDGEFRDNAERIVRPDSVAILPNKVGRCSIEDGCGINPEMVANSDLSIPMTDDGEKPEDQAMRTNKTVDGIEFTGTASGHLDESEIPNDDYESHYVFAEDTKTASSFPLVDEDGNLRSGNIESAFRFRSDAPDMERLVDILREVNTEFDNPPIDPSNFEDLSTNSAFDRIKSFLGIDNLGKNSQSEDAEQQEKMNRNDKIEYIVNNSALTERSLSDRCDDGVDAIYTDVEANAKGEESDDTGSEARRLIEELMDAGMTQSEIGSRVDRDPDTISAIVNSEINNPPESLLEDLRNIEPPESMSENNEDKITFESEAELEEHIDEVVANRLEQHKNKTQKEEIAEDIVANSAEYEDTEQVLDDFPTKAALQTKRETLSDDAIMPGNGVSANISHGDSDPDIDVSSGVLTE